MTRIDSKHRGPLINVATWISLVTMIIFSFSKVATKWTMVRKLQADDIFMIIAAVGSYILGPTGGSGHWSADMCIVYGCRLLRSSLNTSSVRLGPAQERIG